MASSLQTLPDEVLQVVMDRVADLYGKKALLRLLSVSRSFKAWAERHAFRKVVIRSEDQALRLGHALHDQLRFCRPSRYVMSLWVLYDGTDPCSETPLISLAHGVAKCPNLEHLAIDPRLITVIGSNLPNLRIPRLSVLNVPPSTTVLRTTDNCIEWPAVTHLHIMLGDNGPNEVQDGILGQHEDKFQSLQHATLELTYAHPNARLFRQSYSSEMALFAIFQAEDLIRKVLERYPKLQGILIRSCFNQSRFRALWDDLLVRFSDTPRVTFKLETLRREESFVDALLTDSYDRSEAWQDVIEDTLAVIERQWSASRSND